MSASRETFQSRVMFGLSEARGLVEVTVHVQRRWWDVQSRWWLWRLTRPPAELRSGARSVSLLGLGASRMSRWFEEDPLSDGTLSGAEVTLHGYPGRLAAWLVWWSERCPARLLWPSRVFVSPADRKRGVLPW